jgi:hypothetical protein
MTERFAGCIHVLQSEVCILLQDVPTDISVRKRSLDSFVILFIYLFMFYYSFLLLFTCFHKNISTKIMRNLCQLRGI